MDEPAATSRYHSTLADHPDIRDILPRFVARLPGYVQQIRECRAAADHPRLLPLLHQLHGTGKSYGFAELSTLAATAEFALLANAPASEISPALDALIAYIQHIEGYTP